MIKLAVIGDPVAHSKSPRLHAAFLRETGLEGTYEAIRVPAGTCAQAVRELAAAGYLGLNVTTPLKEEAYALCDALDDTAKRSGSVNTLTLLPNSVVGANTDGLGALDSVRTALGAPVVDKNMLLLGVGPTARAVAITLQTHGARVFVWNRTAERARAFAEDFSVTMWKEEIALDLILSSLPPNAHIAEHVLRALIEAPVVIDMNYGPRATLAQTIHRSIIDGEHMLSAQARASFDIWRTHVEAHIDPLPRGRS